jgi:hypothetical protein
LRKPSLSEWAAIGELVGTFAVFVSLLFVVYSINQNTAAIQGSTENIRHRRGLLATDQWDAWDGYFGEIFSAGAERLSPDQWGSLAYGYDPEFWDHVGASLFPR